SLRWRSLGKTTTLHSNRQCCIRVVVFYLRPSVRLRCTWWTKTKPLADCRRLCCPSAGVGMSALGHKWTFQNVRSMSALPPIADMVQRDRDVRFVPKADIGNDFMQGRIIASPSLQPWDREDAASKTVPSLEYRSLSMSRCLLLTQSGHEAAACLGATCDPILSLKCDILPFARVTLGTRKAYGTAGIHYTSWWRCR